METYFSERDKKNNDKLNRILQEDLPPFCEEYFVGIANNTTSLTRLNYAYDIRTFFRYLVSSVSRFKEKDVRDITLSDLENLSAFEIEKYLQYLSHYTKDDARSFGNAELGKKRKLSAIRALITYFIKKQVIFRDPTVSVANPKIRTKDIVRLERAEIGEMLDVVDTGSGLSERQKKYQENTKLRDTAIVALFLGTGIRVSELVGIDVDDVDFSNFSFSVTRKGGARVILYFSEEVAGMLYDYYSVRITNSKCDKKEKALFLSLRNKRITTRAVENIVKKYSSIAAPLKHITPHKLRSTFGTELYRTTGDIYVVADVLGHKDVNTTKRHYAAISDQTRRNASSKVILRPDENDSDKEE